MKASFFSILFFCTTLSAKEPPNILFLIADDLRPELGCYGGLAKTPHLDGLAERGLRFDRAYCQKAVCWPSRNSFFSGLMPDRLGEASAEETFRVSHPEIASLPQWFKQRGWFTAGFGKILHNGQDDPVSWSQPLYEPPSLHYASPENHDKHPIINRYDPKNNINPLFESADVDDDAYEDGQTANAAIETLREVAENDGPFFLMVDFHKPHSPFNAPKEYWDLYNRAEIPLAEFDRPPTDAPERYVFHPSRYLRSFADFPEQGNIPEAIARETIHGYLACTSYIDALTGRILEALEKSGEAGNTIVLFTSDHGYHLGDHGLWSKHTTFEIATRVPLLLAGPGIAENRETETLVELVDLFPTLCDLAGLKKPGHLAGQSFATTDPWKPARETAYSEFSRAGATGRSIRTDRYRYTEWRDSKNENLRATELYDHKIDPLETRNLAELTDSKGTIDRLAELLQNRAE